MSRTTWNQRDKRAKKTQHRKQKQYTKPIHQLENRTGATTDMNSNNLTQPNENKIIETS